MGGKSGSGRARSVSASGQIPLGFDVVVEPSAPPVTERADFKDPDPRRIVIGSSTLGDFMGLSGLSWVVDMRTLLRSLDWSSYESRYKAGGRPPYHPVNLVGLLLLGHITGLTSLRQMDQLGRTDVRAWWLTGGIMPDYSSLCRFVIRHAADLTEATFEALTQRILTQLGSKADSVFIDGTVVQAAASRWRLLKQEAAAQAAREARAAAQEAPEDKALACKADLAEQALQIVQDRDAGRVAKGRTADAKVAPHEPDAVYQPLKEGGYAPSYKPSAAANADRIVVAKQVEASNEAKQVGGLLDQATRVAQTPVRTAALDAGYNNAEVLESCDRCNVEVLCPEGKTTGGENSWVQERSNIGKDKFQYHAERDCYICPQGRELVFEFRCRPTNGAPPYNRYKSISCEQCPLRQQCIGPKSSQRTVKRYAHDARKEVLRATMAQPDARARYKQRQASIEPVHGEQKHIQNMRRFRRRGLSKVRLEYSLHCMAHNLRRFRALRAKTPGKNGSGPGKSTQRG